MSLLTLSQHAARALRVALALGLCIVIAAPRTAHAQAAGTTAEATPRELQAVKVEEQLDAPVPLDATFHDLAGKDVKLGDFIDGKRPTLLTFAYFNCPMLCSLILSSAASSMSKIPWTIGKEFDVITISIDPHETTARAQSKHDALVAEYGRPGAQDGWHFLLGDEKQIARVTDAVGYRFHYDEETKQFAHPGTLILLQPNGHVSRYLYGLEYPPNDLRLGLLEASQGKLISTTEQVLLFCYRFDPHQGKYVLVANRVMRIGAALTLLFLGGFLTLFWSRERKKSKLSASLASPTLPSPSPLSPSPASPSLGGAVASNGAVAPMETRK